jgi:hypothetical protein
VSGGGRSSILSRVTRPVPTPAAEKLAARAGARWTLPAIVAIALALRLYFALTHPIDYNAYWHVFIARNLTREYAGLAHPPLFLLLLKLADAVSHSALAYQSVPLLSGLGVVVLTQRVLARLRVSFETAHLGALTMAVAQPAVILSCGVQSYMLAAFFILWSLLPYLDLIVPQPTTGWRTRAAFAVLVSLGLLTEYYTAFYLLACVAAPALVALFRKTYRAALVHNVARRLAADVATLLPPAAVGGLIYVLVARRWVQKFNTFPDFYYRPGQETVAAFLIRNLWNLVNIFSPFTFWNPRTAACLVLGFVAAVFLVCVRDRVSEASSSDRAMPAAILTSLLGIGMVMGLKGPYPFGGLMRQQFLYFLFAIPAGFVAFDRVLAGVGRIRLRRALAAAVALLLTANLAWHARDFKNLGHLDFAVQARLFDRAFPDAAIVQIDQFNLIGFFMPHDDWSWRFVGREPGQPLVERYEITGDGKQLTLIAHRTVWNFDFHDVSLYPTLASALHPADPDCFTVFCVHPNLYKPPERRLPDFDSMETIARISELAPAGHLTPRKIEIRGNDIFASFCRAPGSH